MDDNEIAICRSAIKRIAWLETREERIAALNEYAQPLRGVIERGVAQVYPVVREKRATKQERKK